MGGKIGVDDRYGGGSTFWVEIEMDAATGDLPSSRRPIKLNGARILVVDDLDINRTIFRLQLEEHGAIIAEAASGRACLNALRRAQARGTPYNLVLMDHMMPEMAGYTAAERIRADPDLHQPRLVLASSIGAPLSTEPAASAGFDAFLTKPVRHQALIECLSDVMAGPPPELVVETLESPLKATAAPSAALARVLLAEDNAINTLLATTLLEAAGYSVEAVMNGAEAVEAVERTPYDLVLMDVHMPVMDGLEACRRIRALDTEGGRVPIVAMTANVMTNHREACLEAGMDDFVSKPFDPDAFLTVVARSLELEDAGRALPAQTYGLSAQRS